MRPNPTSHLLLPFAACNAAAWRPTLQAMPQGKLAHLGKLLQGMHKVETDTRGENTLSPPHERALARALGLATSQTPDGLIPWAAQSAIAHLPACRGKGWAWITPCHWAMGHLHATLTDPAALDLRESESRRLLAIVQPYFETDGITLHYLAPDRWLAEAALFRTLPTASLDRVLARNVDAWLPDAPEAAALRRLQNEVQMLLYTHPFNDERAAKGQLPVNSFWVSGTGEWPGAGITPAAGISAPRHLAEAVFKEDWVGYAQAWEQLDAGEIQQLLQRQRAGETVQLTLCGEQSAQTFETRQTRPWTKITSLFRPLRILDLLEKL
ncbi:MAG: hypothetical protein JWR68_1730 [Polaromonas sp.]|nr:hypothetical protein [Polaromonas sp.]